MKESFIFEESMQKCEAKCEGIYTCEGNVKELCAVIWEYNYHE